MSLSPVYKFAYDYVERHAQLDPVGATLEGITTYNNVVTDYSPEGIAERSAFNETSLQALPNIPITEDRDRIARDVMMRYLESAKRYQEIGEPWRELRVLSGIPTSLRECFDQMPRESKDDWQVIAERMSAVPQSLKSFTTTLRDGMQRGILASKRQTLACAQQGRTWGGLEGDENTFFARLAEKYTEDDSLAQALVSAAEQATTAYAELAEFLTKEYAPEADPSDAAGSQRYDVLTEAFLGSQINMTETYDWGWSEVHKIEKEMERVGNEILPEAEIGEVADFLNNDPTRTIEGVEPFRAWLQNRMDDAMSRLNGVHFDIPKPIQLVEAMIAPPGGAAAMYYTGPSEDLSRPGRTWYPTQGRTTFPLWHELTTCYHEGVPGHHLQVGQVRVLADELSRFQRLMGFVSGHGEGWALYAELLMGELGFHDDSAFVFGMLQAQLFRAARVVVDIGLHLELSIPNTEDFHPGERWNPELAFQYMDSLTRQPEKFLRSEIDRYLGLPGQAISYKVGERVWLDARSDAQSRHGNDFNLKDFHSYALDLGPMGLRQLQEELARF